MTEANQAEVRARIDSDVSAAIDKHGHAQLIFDNYGRAIRRSQGGKLHSMLYRLLVDSEAARDTGALLVARPNDSLDLNFAGSPLLSRAQARVLPELGADDAAALDIGLADLKKMTGASTWLARRFLGVSARQGAVSGVEHLNNDKRRIVEALPPGAVEVLVGVRSACDHSSREALHCLGSTNADGEFEPSELVQQSGLLEAVHRASPSWPTARRESVQRFADMLAGSEDAIWVDRYLFSNPPKVRKFLDDLRRLTDARLRLLVSRDSDRPNFAREISSAVSGLVDIQVRFMHPYDRRMLHDRHLVIPAKQSGFVLPTARVILGVDEPGSAVSVPIPTLGADYGKYWRSGTQVVPS